VYEAVNFLRNLKIYEEHKLKQEWLMNLFTYPRTCQQMTLMKSKCFVQKQLKTL
jgi:hypothetical protein